MQKLKVLDLFSGIGGFSLGLERTGGFETVAFCEYDKKARLVLNKHWPEVPIYNDVRTVEHDGPIDVITGGYPCQPFSVAGKRKGKEDDRHLWPAMFSLIKKHRPSWVIGENVTGHIDLGLDEVLDDLEGEDYTTRTFIIPACAVNAPHRRDRLWIIANANGNGSQKNSNKIRVCQQSNKGKPRSGRSSEVGHAQQWLETRPIGARPMGVGNGIPGEVDRIKQCGNSVVPQIPEAIGNAILESEFNNG